MATKTLTVPEICAAAKEASRAVGSAPSAVRDAALLEMARALEGRPTVAVVWSAVGRAAGNAVVVRGWSMATRSSAGLASVARGAVESAGLPAASVSLVSGGGRDELRELATQSGVVDVIIPRGGE